MAFVSSRTTPLRAAQAAPSRRDVRRGGRSAARAVASWLGSFVLFVAFLFAVLRPAASPQLTAGALRLAATPFHDGHAELFAAPSSAPRVAALRTEVERDPASPRHPAPFTRASSAFALASRAPSVTLGAYVVPPAAHIARAPTQPELMVFLN